MEKKKITISLSPETIELVKMMAKDKDKPVSQMVELAVRAAHPVKQDPKQRIAMVSGDQVAEKFHQVYEELAPNMGYATRKESAVMWADVPEKNRDLMIATARMVLEWLRQEIQDD